MAEVGTLRGALIDELRDTYDAERQLTKAMAKIGEGAATAPAAGGFPSHLKETHGHALGDTRGDSPTRSTQ